MERNTTDSRFQRVCDATQSELARLPIPGAAVGVLCGDQEFRAGFGVTNINHPLPVTADTLFQIGSITKTFVATLLMRLVEAGKLVLDAPLRTYLPELQLRDEYAAQNATLYHCLTHTGGWLGDYFDDFGRGENALAKMVAAMAQLPQITPLGELWSYNNAGFYLAGRVIERVMRQPFETVMQAWIFRPLQLEHSYFFAEEVMTHSFAVGHERADDRAVVAQPWALARTAHPAGGIISNLADLFRYARFQMGDGTTAQGTRLLTPESLNAMRTPRVPATDPQSVGLAWFLYEINGVKFIEHGGGTKGQITRLVIAPQEKFAAAILTNSAVGGTLITNVLNESLRAFLQLEVTPPAPLVLDATQLAAYAGRYDAALDCVDVSVAQDKLVLQVTPHGGFPTPQTPPPPTPPPVTAQFYAPDRILVLDEPYKNARAEFLRHANGDIAWLRLGSRAHKRL
jgi:CubicO group peptidase (beta-lactamase class C family)